MLRKILNWLLVTFLLTTVSMAEAQQTKEPRIAVIGAPEEPRFSEVVAGLKKGLGELGYAPPSLVVHEIKIARAEEKSAKSIVEDLLRQKAQVLFLIGSRLLKPVREASAEVPVIFITPGDPVAAGLVASPARRQHHRHDFRISRAFRKTSRACQRDSAASTACPRCL
jgi:ABC-type uncharacterized transport system substrate-binding protein